MIARTSNNVFHVNLAAMFPQTVAFQCLIDVFSSSLDKTSIRQLQVAVLLRLNIAKRVT